MKKNTIALLCITTLTTSFALGGPKKSGSKPAKQKNSSQGAAPQGTTTTPKTNPTTRTTTGLHQPFGGVNGIRKSVRDKLKKKTS